jgi:protein-S-isoprenylcysteine O-methyltransferase Ste14
MSSARVRSTGWLLVAVQFVLFAAVLFLPRRAQTSEWLLILGGVLTVAGVVVVGLAFVRLGGALTPTPVPLPGAGLRTDGIYGRVRHPIYSGILLIAIGIVVAIGSWWTCAWLVVLVVFFIIKSRWEDRLLAEAYGTDWHEWAARTGGLFPRF